MSVQFLRLYVINIIILLYRADIYHNSAG